MPNFPERLTALQPFWNAWYLDEVLGEGGFGKVYRIYREEFGTRYYAAMKWISLPTSQSEIVAMRARGMNDNDIRSYLEQHVRDLQSEINLMSSLRGSSHIVSYEDHAFIPRRNEIGWDILIRMELLTPLTQRMAAGMTVGDVVRMGIDMCDALSLCAYKKIVHRDIKPDNIFINSVGEYKLGDFGVARQMHSDLTQMSIKGTPVYMAPEVYGNKTGDNSVDQYSLGLVMHRLLNAQQIPFAPAYHRILTHEEREQAFARRLNGEPVPLPIQGSQKLKEIVRKACSYQAKKRYRSPDQMRLALQETVRDKECAEPLLNMSAAKIVSGRSTMQPKKKDSLPILAAGIGVVALVAVLAVILALVAKPKPDDDGPAKTATSSQTVAEATETVTPEAWKGYAVVEEKNTMLYSSYLTETMMHPLEQAEVVEVVGWQSENGKNWLMVQVGDEWGYVQDGSLRQMTDEEAEAYVRSLATDTPVPTEEPTEEPTATPEPTEEPTEVPTEEPTEVPTEEPTPVPTETPTSVPEEEPTKDRTGAVASIPVPDGWGMLMEDAYNGNDRYTVLGSQYKRNTIYSITFTDDLSGKAGDAWDVSFNGDGSVWAWVKPSSAAAAGNTERYDLFIASEGGVRLPSESNGLFCGYNQAVSIDFGHYVDTSEVTNMNIMFGHCYQLKTLDLTSFDTSNVTIMANMFLLCRSLTAVDLSSFDTSKVTAMNFMFDQCSSLETLDVSSFNTARVRGMNHMFSDCSALTELDLVSFDTFNVNQMVAMFSGCTNLTLITVCDRFVIPEHASDQMFNRCPVGSPEGLTLR